MPICILASKKDGWAWLYHAFVCDYKYFEKKVSYLDILVESKVNAIIGVGSTDEDKRFYEKLKNMSVIMPMALLNIKNAD